MESPLKCVYYFSFALFISRLYITGNIYNFNHRYLCQRPFRFVKRNRRTFFAAASTRRRRKYAKTGFLQCCGSGMFIPDPGSRILIFTHPGSRIPDLGSRIPDPKTGRKERGEKKKFFQTLFCSHKFHKM